MCEELFSQENTFCDIYLQYSYEKQDDFFSIICREINSLFYHFLRAKCYMYQYLPLNVILATGVCLKISGCNLVGRKSILIASLGGDTDTLCKGDIQHR